MTAPERLARAELAELPACAREDEAEARLRLDANEVPWRPPGDATRAGLNRYPPVRAFELERRLAAYYGVAPDRLLATRGSDEAIDLLVRAFCRPGRDAVVTLPPTFGMYAWSARVQGARVVEVRRKRRRGFAIDVEQVAARLESVKLVFVPNPDNPTGRRARRRELSGLAAATAGRALLVVDEAYAEFACGASVLAWLDDWAHLVVLRTLSKAHALAGARCGAVVARPEVVELLARVLPPFALAAPSIEAAIAQLAPSSVAATGRRLAGLVAERERLAAALAAAPAVRRVFPSAANFLLVAFRDVARAAEALAAHGIAARRFDDRAIADCLRLTIGTRAENRRLLAAVGTA